ncbi:MAG: SPOR domain-containing protein [Alphaproteobacteria bacterium]|nr:SPOR domain-containing protein [Alphaproteobacteria bacterium]
MVATNRAALRGGTLLLVLGLGLSGCENVELPKFSFGAKKQTTADATPEVGGSTRLVERDVEAPDVFQTTDSALWDGRPSLGGVWVAYPGDIQPERVIIRNEENKKFVIGALFKRERDNPGPKIQLSSEAAAALGILAGKPTVLNVTALRRESVPEVVEPVTTAKPEPRKPADAAIASIATTAIDKAEGKKTETAAAVPKPAPAPKPKTGLAKPFIQIGIFSVEANANNTATSLRTQGVIPVVKAQQSKGKKFWRVLIGPATSKSERASLLKVARKLGFDDAYFVSR